MTRVRIVALGNDMAGDDGAGLEAVRRLEARLAANGSDGTVDMILAGRPGAALLDLLPAAVPVVLVDVTRSGAAPGTIFSLALDDLTGAITGERQVSSHGFGPGETLRLGQVLGRPLPRGRFVGIEGGSFDVGAGLSPAVARALDAMVAAVLRAARDLGAPLDALVFP
jgi:hydrogenase maturation protease